MDLFIQMLAAWLKWLTEFPWRMSGTYWIITLLAVLVICVAATIILGIGY
ncbi:MAG: hypothetical protein WA040_17085 [Anaerolineae bacterium]